MPGVMQWQLELAALGLALTGWLCAILTRCLALWTVSGTVDNTTATLPAYWDGVWLEWDHWDLSHDGSLHCSFYRSLMSLSGSFRTWRALVMAAIGAGGFAAAIGAAGAVWFPTRGQVKVFSGALFVVSGILLLVPTAWTCHHTGQPLEGAVLLRRDWGPALYLGWISFALMVAGGAFLATRCPTGERPAERPGDDPSPEEGASHPLSRINRTTFTHSQYERRSEPL
ncbi:claudin-4-like [Anarhichas minor]|uniref:claudin-4-like n=1 Tax=Anarhichas minor TaxID=65739 RepID=UPI003F73540A